MYAHALSKNLLDEKENTPKFTKSLQAFVWILLYLQIQYSIFSVCSHL